LHAYLKHGNHVARFSFSVLDLPATKPKFIERLEDDYIVREPRQEVLTLPKIEPASVAPPRIASKPAEAPHAPTTPVTKPDTETPKETQTEFTFGPRF
jgi:hypothetical protein